MTPARLYPPGCLLLYKSSREKQSGRINRRSAPFGRGYSAESLILDPRANDCVGASKKNLQCGQNLPLPDLREGPKFNAKRPGRTVLMGDAIHFLSNCWWFREELVRLVRSQYWASTRRINSSVDNEIGHVDSFRSEFSRH